MFIKKHINSQLIGVKKFRQASSRVGREGGTITKVKKGHAYNLYSKISAHS